jgi:hypothetical protein
MDLVKLVDLGIFDDFGGDFFRRFFARFILGIFVGIFGRLIFNSLCDCLGNFWEIFAHNLGQIFFDAFEMNILKIFLTQ